MPSGGPTGAHGSSGPSGSPQLAPDLTPVQPVTVLNPRHPLYALGQVSPADPATQVTCPLLGIPDDPRTRFTFATPSHRCYASSKADPIDLVHQGVYCLAARHPECGRFRGTTEKRPHPRRRVLVGLVRALAFVAAVVLIGYLSMTFPYISELPA